MGYKTSVELLTDDEGMLGRECPNPKCKDYFKVRLGSVNDIDSLSCPYCSTEGGKLDFLTADQLKYLETSAAKQLIEPILRDFAKTINGLNRRQRGDLVQPSFSVKHRGVRLHRYQERQLETRIDCDSCGLEFAVYGRFASCPTCAKLNALSVFLGSLETTRKKLVLSRDENFGADLREEFVKDSLGGSVGAFDAFGKEMRARRAVIRLSSKPNLFQDIEMLDQELQEVGVPSIEVLIGGEAWEDLKWFFQARHVYLHSAGVADSKFISKQPSYAHMLGRILPLDVDRLQRNVDVLCDLARELDARLV